MTALQKLCLYDSKFTGWRGTLFICKLLLLAKIVKNKNMFWICVGPLPPELGRLTNLVNLNTMFNRFSGFIPAQLYRLSNMTVLNLSNNKLTGMTYPFQSLMLPLTYPLPMVRTSFATDLPSVKINITGYEQKRFLRFAITF